jgi:hypothetical protein
MHGETSCANHCAQKTLKSIVLQFFKTISLIEQAQAIKLFDILQECGGKGIVLFLNLTLE